MGKMEYGGPLIHGRLIFQYFPNNLPLFMSLIRGSEQHTIDYQQHTRIIHKQNWRNICIIIIKCGGRKLACQVRRLKRGSSSP